jgi:eukaryotic-like serine/threonine-protein kinase
VITVSESERLQRWRALSALLDQLLDMEASERQAWLASAAMTDQDRATLAAMLHEDGSFASGLSLDLLSLADASSEEDANDATPQADFTSHLISGQRLGAYQLVREIGRGGMGSVWLGERADGLYHGQVAIKLLNGAVLRNVGARHRFAREGEILSKLAHPNIARLLDAGATDLGARYLVLEFIDGVSLQAFCVDKRLGIRATVELFCQALEAVAYAHSLLILHRDIKPGNVLVNRDGQVKLLDFGLGKLLSVETSIETDDMTRLGGPGYTPRYAPPEQMTGAAMGTASDVYSLGVTLYEILTNTQLDLSQRYTRPSERLSSDATRSDLSREVRGDLDSIVAKAVSDRPQDRYANAAAQICPRGRVSCQAERSLVRD